MTTQIKNGNQGAIIRANGLGFYTTIHLNCRENFDDSTVVRGKTHTTQAGAIRWANNQIGLPTTKAQAIST